MKITKYVADWFKRADDDIKSVEVLLNEEGLFNPVCFHAQQAVEKYLKGFLAYHEKHVRKTHDLIVLSILCQKVDSSFKEIKDEVNYLSQFYFETRYPGDYPEFTLDEAKHALKAARIIKKFIFDTIGYKEK